MNTAPVKAPPAKLAQINAMLNELYRRGANGQELSIGTTERGWVLKIHSCYSSMEVVILVPSDPNQPVEIVSDTRATATAEDDA